MAIYLWKWKCCWKYLSWFSCFTYWPGHLWVGGVLLQHWCYHREMICCVLILRRFWCCWLGDVKCPLNALVFVMLLVIFTLPKCVWPMVMHSLTMFNMYTHSHTQTIQLLQLNHIFGMFNPGKIPLFDIWKWPLWCSRWLDTNDQIEHLQSQSLLYRCLYCFENLRWFTGKFW